MNELALRAIETFQLYFETCDPSFALVSQPNWWFVPSEVFGGGTGARAAELVADGLVEGEAGERVD